MTRAVDLRALRRSLGQLTRGELLIVAQRAAEMGAADCVRNYKSLANVERAFRSLKTIDLKVRPIHHRTADRVRAHIFL